MQVSDNKAVFVLMLEWKIVCPCPQFVSALSLAGEEIREELRTWSGLLHIGLARGSSEQRQRHDAILNWNIFLELIFARLLLKLGLPLGCNVLYPFSTNLYMCAYIKVT